MKLIYQSNVCRDYIGISLVMLFIGIIICFVTFLTINIWNCFDYFVIPNLLLIAICIYLLILLFDVSCWQLLGKESLYLSDDKLILQKKKLFNTKDEFYLKNIESIEIHSHQVNYSKIFLFGLINRETLYLLGLRGKIMIHLLSKKDTIELASGLDDVKAEIVQKELLELIGKTTN